MRYALLLLAAACAGCAHRQWISATPSERDLALGCDSRYVECFVDPMAVEEFCRKNLAVVEHNGLECKRDRNGIMRIDTP